MAWDRDGSQRELTRAVKALDTRRVDELCAELVDHLARQDAAYPQLPARVILGVLRGGRHVARVEQVADALVRAGGEDPAIRRHHAQALLDRGQLVAAEVVLRRLVADTTGAEAEQAEARGLLGRAYKQMYLATRAEAPERRRRSLQRAIAAYADAYRESAQRRWHAINAVALLRRAERDGIAIDGAPDATAMAEEILAAVEALGDAGPWDRASAMEACVALGRTEPALQWLDAYLADADAFGIAATLRQLTELWELEPATDPGRHLIPPLQAALLDHEDGPTDVRVGAADIAPAATARIDADPGFEKVLGTERFESLKWFRTALERCRAVGRVEDATERPVGTCFLVAGPTLHAAFPPLVLVTNAHVISATEPLALRPDDARITFRALEAAPASYRVSRLLWSSPVGELDTTIVELDGYPADVGSCPLAAHRPALDSDPLPQTYIIGHPGGGDQVMLSVRDNQVLDGDDVHLHYRTPTEGGSSGSPVFDRQWELIAIHHAGRTNMPRLHGRPGSYPANEGIWLDRVAEAVRQAGPASG
jgi:hypothetical protein